MPQVSHLKGLWKKDKNLLHKCGAIEFFQASTANKYFDLPVLEVPSFVVLHVTLCREALAAIQGAGEGAHIEVDSRVNF